MFDVLSFRIVVIRSNLTTNLTIYLINMYSRVLVSHPRTCHKALELSCVRYVYSCVEMVESHVSLG